MHGMQFSSQKKKMFLTQGAILHHLGQIFQHGLKIKNKIGDQGTNE